MTENGQQKKYTTYLREEKRQENSLKSTERYEEKEKRTR